jgi:hypothetical protein
MDLKGMCINTTNWVDSAQVRDYRRALVNAALNLWVPSAMELVKPIRKRPCGRPSVDGRTILE